MRRLKNCFETGGDRTVHVGDQSFEVKECNGDPGGQGLSCRNIKHKPPPPSKLLEFLAQGGIVLKLSNVVHDISPGLFSISPN